MIRSQARRVKMVSWIAHVGLGIAVKPAAHLGILSFAVLPDDDEVDVSRVTPVERLVIPSSKRADAD